MLDSQLSPKSIGEKALVLHIEKSRAGDLIIYDREYSSYGFIAAHCRKEVAYPMRAKVSFSNLTKAFIASSKRSQIVEIHPGHNVIVSQKRYGKNTPIKVRLVRVDLPGGETELLMTSLLDSKKYPYKIFKELYFKRWGVETFYDELKNKLRVENFSGYSNQSILQDLNAALHRLNCKCALTAAGRSSS